MRPDANFVDASDPQSWLLGRVNRIYSSSGASAADAELFRQGRLHHRLTRTKASCRTSPTESSPMSPTLDGFSRLPKLRLAALLCARAISLAGCGVNYASNDGVPAGDYHERLSDRAWRGADLARRLSGRRRRARRPVGRRDSAASPQRYQALGSGRIAILAPAAERERDGTAIDQIRRALRRRGPARLCRRRLLPDPERSDRSLRRCGWSSRAEGDGAGALRPMAERSRLRRLDRRAGRTRPTRTSAAPRSRRCAAQVDDPRDLVQSPRHSAPATSRCGCGRSTTCATARIRAPTGRPSSRRSAKSEGD